MRHFVSKKKDEWGCGHLVNPFTYKRFQQALDTFCRYRKAATEKVVPLGELDKLFAPSDGKTAVHSNACRRAP